MLEKFRDNVLNLKDRIMHAIYPLNVYIFAELYVVIRKYCKQHYALSDLYIHDVVPWKFDYSVGNNVSHTPGIGLLTRNL